MTLLLRGIIVFEGAPPLQTSPQRYLSKIAASPCQASLLTSIGLALRNNVTLKTITHSDHGKQKRNCEIAPPRHGHGTSIKTSMRTPVLRLSNPHLSREAVIAPIPMNRTAMIMKTKKDIEPASCARLIVRGNMPMADRAIEPRRRLTIPHLPNRLDSRLLPRPIAKMRLSTPAKISPQLNSIVAGPSTPR